MFFDWQNENSLTFFVIGYTGNGHYCKDVDECQVNNGGCSQLPFVACINTQVISKSFILISKVIDFIFQKGSSRCAACPFGYTGDGKICIRSSPSYLPPPSVAPGNGDVIRPTIGRSCEGGINICHPLARCVQNRFTVSCICPFGYIGDGYGIFGCTQTNSTADPCSSNPCLNGGTCTHSGLFGYRCECPPGTLMPRCISFSSACSSNPCQNGGTCRTVGRVGYRCSCPTGRVGYRCQLEQRTCGGVLNAINGTLKYPLSNAYPHNSRCAWLIKTDEDKVLNITFTKFELEGSRECRFDWLQIHDGRSSASYMIGR